jgi:ribosomal protein S18 acetylase RimI-like enzyme
MHVREATGDDIRPLQIQFSMSPQWAERNRHRLTDGTVLFFVVESAGERLGFVEARVVEIGRDGRAAAGDPESILGPQRIGTVDCIRVADTAKTRQVAEELTQRLTTQLRSLDVTAIEITFGDADRDLGAMMEQLDFKPSRIVLQRDL